VRHKHTQDKDCSIVFELAGPRLNFSKTLVVFAATLLAGVFPKAFGLDSLQLHAQTAAAQVPSAQPSTVPEWQINPRQSTRMHR
jgi:hypothetical protein